MIREEIVRIRAALAGYRYRFACEDELHQGLISAMSAAQLAFGHEVIVGEAGRIDFLITSHLRKFVWPTPRLIAEDPSASVPRPVHIGLEVKVRGSVAEIAEQLIRYVGSDDIDGILLVTSRNQHRGQFPAELLGKPLELLIVGGLA